MHSTWVYVFVVSIRFKAVNTHVMVFPLPVGHFTIASNGGFAINDGINAVWFFVGLSIPMAFKPYIKSGFLKKG